MQHNCIRTNQNRTTFTGSGPFLTDARTVVKNILTGRRMLDKAFLMLETLEKRPTITSLREANAGVTVTRSSIAKERTRFLDSILRSETDDLGGSDHQMF
ncbi:hypothetical protein SLA2020_290700 [Shorea laevis]